MSKKINFVYEWIGPKGPITNNRTPTINDLMTANVDYHFPQIRGDLFQRPHFHTRIVNSEIYSSYKIPKGNFIYELNWTTFHYRDVLANFKPGAGFLDNNSISEEVIHRVKNKTGFFLITLFYEGYMDEELLEKIEEYFLSKSIPLSQVIYMTNCYNAQEIYKEYCDKKNKQPELNLEYFPIFRIDKCDVGRAIESSLVTPYKPGPREKTFLCFNRRYNDHRLMLYMTVVKRKLLSKFYISMAKFQPEAGRTFRENAKYLIYRFNDMGLNVDDIIESDRNLPLILDNPNFNSYPMEQNIDPLYAYYSNSLVNIVTETYFFSKVIHLTEKTYKPIAFMQPFILLAAAGSLKHLHDMGFKTFNEFWDESYDQETDDKKRFLKIAELIEEISNWSDEKKIDFSHAVADTLNYNVRVLKDIKDSEIDNFVNKYGN